MNIIIFDTETTSLNIPYCYNIGYVVYNTDTKTVLLTKDFIVEQVWHNIPLFNTAYYACKRPLYVSRMRGKTVKMKKYGYIMQELLNDIKKFDISAAYAYNSSFDEKVFAFNCEWYKCSNPLETIPVYDIRGYVHKTIAFSKEFQNYCETYNRFTDSGNYSTTAETLFGYISNAPDFTEEHTALNDSIIECEILKKCIELGAEWSTAYTVYKTIMREKADRKLTIYVNGKKDKEYNYSNYCKRLDNIYIKY